MRRAFSALLAVIMSLSLFPTAILADGTATAVRNDAVIEIDGVRSYVEAYVIGGNNYFKLRDLALAMNGTAKQFEVTWDETKKAVNLLRGKPYTPDGSELSSAYDPTPKAAALSTAKIYLDHEEIRVTAYAIGGYNYFKLRDLAAALNIYLRWDAAAGEIKIDTLFPYVPDGAGSSYAFRSDVSVANTMRAFRDRWASISSVQQFPYKNEGLAYAYVQDGRLIIVTPGKELSVDMLYPELGDVIADEDGNFYVIWGRDNRRDGEIVETVFVSKYSPEGAHIKTTGFVGESKPWGSSDAAKTKVPFRHGNSVSAIGNGILVNYHTKQRYDGHQSDNVIAVRLSDLSPYELPNNTYSGHSFNQSVIYSKKLSDFLFASQGDAYPRGFRVNDSSGRYGDKDDLTFTFYLEPNADYNMYIVNETFAQLGGIVETSKGVALVGASAKSIGEAAKTEKQNLFVQIFDPLAPKRSPSAYIGGTARSGATSYDIYDNQNAPLTNVTDYGVIWLTDYTDRNVITPQVVAADDRIVILWKEDVGSPVDTYYMVLSAEGNVIKPKTPLGLPLNSFEQPIYHDGRVYWAYALRGKLAVASFEP